MRIYANAINIIWLCCFSLLLSACGFQLRGAAPLPENIQRLAINPYDPYMPLQREIIGLLSYNDITIVDIGQRPDAILYIKSDDFQTTDTSIGTDGRIREKSYNYIVTFTLTNAEGQTLIPLQKVNSLRIIEFNPDLALAQTMEAQVIRNELRRDVARQLVRWLTMAPSEPVAENSTPKLASSATGRKTD